MQDNSAVSAWQHFFDERVRGHKELVSGYLKYLGLMEEKGIPPIFELRHLAQMLAVDEPFLVSVVQDTVAHYRDFSIPKKSGGQRTISVPSPTLLHVQRWIVTEILYKLPVHDAAHGFVPERSIITNAKEHVSGKMVLKMDLCDFFQSIKFKSVMRFFLGLGYPVSVSYFLSRICCNRGSLPQGAATSPALSNLVVRRLDVALSNYALSTNLAYTRYADDVTFSGNEIGGEVINRVSWIVERMGYSVNKRKTRIAGPNGKKIIAGVSVSSGKLALPRSSVRAIKLEVHQLLKRGFFAHAEATGQYDPMLMERLRGRLSFWLQIDPENQTALKLREQLTAYMNGYGA